MIEKVDNKLGEYGKDYMKVKFNSDDVPVDKPLKFHNLTITLRSVLKKMVNYPKKFLGECLYEL